MPINIEGHTGNHAHAEASTTRTPADALAAAKEAALSIPKSQVTSESDSALEVKVGMTFKSWGELVSVSVRPLNEGSAVRVDSRSRMALHDWGKNRANVRNVLRPF